MIHPKIERDLDKHPKDWSDAEVKATALELHRKNSWWGRIKCWWNCRVRPKPPAAE